MPATPIGVTKIAATVAASGVTASAGYVQAESQAIANTVDNLLSKLAVPTATDVTGQAIVFFFASRFPAFTVARLIMPNSVDTRLLGNSLLTCVQKTVSAGAANPFDGLSCADAKAVSGADVYVGEIPAIDGAGTCSLRLPGMGALTTDLWIAAWIGDEGAATLVNAGPGNWNTLATD